MASIDWPARKARTLAHIRNHGNNLTGYAADDHVAWTGENAIPKPNEFERQCDPSPLRQRFHRLYRKYRAGGGKSWETNEWHIDDTPEERLERVCALLDDSIRRMRGTNA